MQYKWNLNIYFSATYHLSVYDVKLKKLGHTHPGIVTPADKGEYKSPNKLMELERNFSFTLSSNYSENHWRLMKYFILKNSFRNQYMVRWYRHSVIFNNLV